MAEHGGIALVPLLILLLPEHEAAFRSHGIPVLEANMPLLTTRKDVEEGRKIGRVALMLFPTKFGLQSRSTPLSFLSIGMPDSIPFQCIRVVVSR